MPDQTPQTEIITESQTLWHTDRSPSGCNHCQRVFLLPPSHDGTNCPLCRRGTLEAQPVRTRPADPERLLPFNISKQDLSRVYEQFTSGVWIKPEDFSAEHLLRRSVPVFWPLWLVDCNIRGNWEMEAGFDYQIESSKDYYEGGQWRSRKQIEDRIRWEPRVGVLETRVDNTTAPALEENDNRMKMTGKYQLNQAIPFNPDYLGGAYLELPDLNPEEAWPLARPRVDQTAARMCANAAGAQHHRNFTIQARYDNLNWTEFFLPMYATYYTDDEGAPQIVITNGMTGTVQGPRLASRKRGMRIAGILAAVAGAIFLLALFGLLIALILPPAGLIAGLLGLLGVFIGICAIIPAVWPGQWNRKQEGPRITNPEGERR